MAIERRPYSSKELRLEKVLSAVYIGGWPAHVWGATPWGRRVTRLDHHLAVPGRDAARPPLRLAFASDLHVGPTTPVPLLEKAFALLRDSAPDVLALGGDYVYLGATRERVRIFRELVDSVPARTKVAVLGNHDFWARPERLEEALAGCGFEVLVNRAIRLPAPHDDVAVFGLDDPLTGDHSPAKMDSEIEMAHAREKDAPVKIALCHSPDGVPAIRGRGMHLFLCGHTHGGHLALPGGKPLLMPSRMGRIWSHGRFEVDGMSLFVSRGVGGSIVPVRTFAPPDVALWTIDGVR